MTKKVINKFTAHQRKRHLSVHYTNVNVIIPPLANTAAAKCTQLF